MRSTRRTVDELTAELARAVSSVSMVENRLELMASALDNLGVGVVVVDEFGDVVLRNSVARVLHNGRGADALVDGVIEEFSRPNGHDVRHRVLDLLGPPARVVEIESTRLGDGEPGQACGWLITVNDITELRRIDKVRTDFVANVSHELKTPIGALSLLAETLLDEPDAAVRARLTEQMTIEADRASGLISALIDLSRIESTAPTLAKVDIRTVVDMSVAWCSAPAHQADVSIIEEVSNMDLTVLADERQLVTAVRNLIDNAIKYSEPGSTVIVRANADVADRVVLAVVDQGCGIPERDIQRVFERFYRVDRARSRDTGGSGLGLSIVRHIIDNHAGAITVTSSEGHGSTFSIALPHANQNSGGTSAASTIEGST